MLTPAVDPFTIDEFHGQIRRSISGAAGIEQMRDVRVIERRKDAPLVSESAPRLDSHRAAVVKQFQRHLLAHFTISTAIDGAFGQIDRAHASLTQQAFNPVVDRGGGRHAAIRQSAHFFKGVIGEKCGHAGGFRGLHQPLDFGRQGDIAAACVVHERCTLLEAQFKCGEHNRLRLLIGLPPVSGHPCPLIDFASCRRLYRTQPFHP